MSKLEHSSNDREMSSTYGIPCTYRGALHRHGDHMFAAAEVMKVRFALPDTVIFLHKSQEQEKMFVCIL